ncbi:NAD(P)H-dependent oxidoreductase [Streptomyces sp. MUM 203J]|uniref:NADPH-dependent FMN reductase n=1 Tax=Streptomyces sp. MUM 203J TaxID=2791990 RepID=UPI001F047B22|nr:NADPH-dependent FMN reductase [Streptomyces sp. MUM 203J]MCH0540286.1 NAD(P)H-dependent oxidoreductase [Streptomyces sp. MUM 203J]
MAKIALLSGSLRRESVNSAALATVRRVVERHRGGHAAFVVPLQSFPLFNEDTPAPRESGALRRALDDCAAADALIISSPAYNGYPPGVLKNALDWLSWGGRRAPLAGLPAAVLSASPGPQGGANVLPHLRRILLNSGAAPIDHDGVAIGDAVRLRTPEGLFTDPGVVARVEDLVDAALMAAADRVLQPL